MGYSYTNDGKLCCDNCSSHTGVRKYPCPFGSCPAVALCPECKKSKPELTSKAAHRKYGCEAYHAQSVARDAQEKALLHAGKFVRCSAFGQGVPYQVKVIFRDQHGKEAAYLMGKAVYDAIAILTPATPDDFAQFGPVVEAKNTNIYDPN